MVKKANSKKTPLTSISPDKKRIISYSSLAILLTLFVFAALLQLIIKPNNQENFHRATLSILSQQKNALENYKTSVTKTLENYSRQKSITDFFNNIENSDPDEIKVQFDKLRNSILNTLSNAKSVSIYLPKEAQNDKDNGGDIGFVELDMINRLERGETVFPEISKDKNSDEWEINWVFGIQKTTNYQPERTPPLAAIIHISTGISGLIEAFSGYNSKHAKIHLQQVIGKQQPLLFLILGEGLGYDKETSKIPLTHWQIEVYPSSLLRETTSTIPLWFILLNITLLVGGVGIAYILANRKNKQDEALYSALDVKVQQRTDLQKGESKTKEELSNPLYLNDQELMISEEDQALIDGAHQDKQQDSTTDSSKNVSTIDVPTHIFRAYDIRGIVDTDLTPEIAEFIGKAVATEALEQGETTLLIGMDTRIHSPLFYEHVERGVTSTGCNVINMGLAPTPLMNFAAEFSDQTNSGIIITASHNPKSYNGFKMVINKRSLVEEDIQRLRDRITSGKLIEGKIGEVVHQDFSQDYINTILSDIVITSDISLVVDAANGAASQLAPQLFKELGCKVTPLFCEFDGNFPNHEPDPSVEANLETLINAVRENNADLGIALDGDGDRLVVVTQSGKIIWPDQLLMLFARDVVSRHPGCDIIFDIKSTRQLNSVISSYGGRPIIWKTGHSHIKAKMQETGALLAGEFSGHIFFKERWFGFDDGLYAATRLLEIMSLRDQSLDDMLAAMPETLATPEIKIAVAEDKKFKIIEKLIETGDFSNGEKIMIDGLRVDYAKGWGLIRASNTSPALTLRFEAQNEKGIEQLKTLFKRELKKVDESLPLDF